LQTKNNLVSVIVPFYNAASFLEVAIQSVLDQSFANWELILVNDGSTDNSVAIAKKYVSDGKIFLLEHPNRENKGVAMSRALAIKFAKGDFISFLDADDFYDKDKIEKNIQVLNGHPEVILVHSAANFIDDSERNHYFFNDFKFEKKDNSYSFLEGDFLNRNHICNSSVMVRSKYLKKANNSFPHIFQYEDWITWILLAQYGKFFYLDEALCSYRFHDQSSTSFLLKNELRSLYAKLEMLFILNERLLDISIKKKVASALNKQLKIISSCYTGATNKNNESGGYFSFGIQKEVLKKLMGYFKSFIN